MKRWLVLFVVLSLFMPILVTACGGSGEEETYTALPTSTATPTSTVTATAAPTTTPSGPLKIGAIAPWSGPAAMTGMLADQIIKLVEWQVKQQGGILRGRDLKVVTYDNRATVPEVQAGVRKLYYEDNVSAIVWGGITVPEFNAGVDMAEELEILFIPLGEADNLAESKFTVNAQVTQKEYVECAVRIMTKLLNAKTVAFFAHEQKDSHTSMGILKPLLDAAGIELVYEAYVPLDSNDYMSYLTKIKHDKPDVLMAGSNGSEFYMTIAKQMMELGGWGDMKLIGWPGAEQSKNMLGAKGWYIAANWAHGVDYPGAAKFFDDFKTVNGRSAVASQIYFYNPLWTAIYAIELAGTNTDRVAIAQAARSGKLEWDTPSGHAHFMPDGTSGLKLIAERVEEGGNLVYVPTPE
jgi:ABC-type branched-subunit amino acid transport system substrate-binding protein